MVIKLLVKHKNHIPFSPRWISLEHKTVCSPTGLQLRFDEVELLASLGKKDEKGNELWEVVNLS